MSIIAIINIHFAGTVDANHLPPRHHSWMPGVTIPGRNYEDDDRHKDDIDRLENGDDHHYEDDDDHHDECDDKNVMMIIIIILLLLLL